MTAIDCAILTSLKITELYEYDPGYILGRIEILDTPHHIEFIEVEYDDAGMMQIVPHDDSANEQRFEELQLTTEEAQFQPVEIDGRMFVCRVEPFAV